MLVNKWTQQPQEVGVITLTVQMWNMEAQRNKTLPNIMHLVKGTRLIWLYILHFCCHAASSVCGKERAKGLK